MTEHPTYPELPSPAEIAAAEIERDPGATHSLASLAALADCSTSTLRRAFIARFGMTPAEYTRAARAGAMRDALRDGRGVTESGYAAGFGSDRAIYEHATRALGMPPSAYRRGAPGLDIAWDSGATALGTVVVGRTERGVCCVLFADDSSAEQALCEEFPRAALRRDPEAVRTDLARVSALIDGKRAGEVPLDLVGTPFQRRVWAELRRIPPGETATYAQVAERIGSPSAVRAVAGACAGNHAAVVVPCHRVVRTDGGLGGYKWGVERKQALLHAEHTQDTHPSR